MTAFPGLLYFSFEYELYVWAFVSEARVIEYNINYIELRECWDKEAERKSLYLFYKL